MADLNPENDKSKYYTDPGSGTTYISQDVAKQYGVKIPDTAFRYTSPPAPTAGPAPAPAAPTAATPTSTAPNLKTVDEATIREDTRKRMQATIDAIDANYANLISQEQVNGQERAGQTRAVNARSGNMGSDFGAAAETKTQVFNEQQVKNLRDQQAAQINAVMQNIEDRATAEIERQRLHNLEDYNIENDKYKDSLARAKEASASAKSDLATLAASGYDLSTMDANKKAALFSQAGYDPEFGDLIYNAMKPKAAQIDYKFEKLADGTGLFYGTDPQTGQLVTQKVSVDLPPDWQVQIAPDGTVLGYNKNTGETKMLSGKGEFAKDDNTPKIVKINGKDYQVDAQGNLTEPSVPQEQASPQSQAQAKGNIDTISGLLNNSALGTAVGPNGFGRLGIVDRVTGAKSNFIASVQQLVSQLSLDSLTQAKQNGATFGALSEGELNLLSSSATKLGSWAIKDKNGNITGFNANEKDFKAELDKINNFAKLDYVLKGGKPEDVGATVTPDGKVWSTNSDGSMQMLTDKLPQAEKPAQYGPPAPTFNSVGKTSASIGKAQPTPAVLATASTFPQGSTGGQCTTFLHKIVDFPPIGDGKSEKFASVDRMGIPATQWRQNVQVGDVVVTSDNPTYGHTFMVNAILGNGKVQVTESNWHGNEKVTYDRIVDINSPAIYGAIRPGSIPKVA